MKVELKIENLVDPIIKKMGFEIEYVEFVKEGSNTVLRIVVDKINGDICIDDCEMISRAIEDTVDENIDREYVLEVSSPGLERQLRSIRLYKKYTGREIHIKLFKKHEELNTKEFNAIILHVDMESEKITLLLEDGEIDLFMKDIATAYTTFDFDSALKGNTDNVNINKLNKFNKNN